MDNNRLCLRPAEVGERLGVSRTKAYELIASGELPSLKVGGCLRVPVAALMNWIDERVKKGDPR